MQAPRGVTILSLSALLAAGCASSGPRVAVRDIARPRSTLPTALAFTDVGGSEHTRTATIATPVRATFAASEPPPAPTSQPREFIPRRPAREALWLEGHWAYTNYRDDPYEWLPGHWEIPPP